MRDMRFSPDMLDAAIDAGLVLLNGGTLTVYTDPRPANPSSPVQAQQLVSFTLADPAFGASVSGVASGNAVADATASSTAGGNATWFRAVSSSGTPCVDGRVDDDGTGDISLSKYEIFAGDTVSLVKWNFVLPPRA